MASPAVTYTFTNSTVADADEVNTNFADIINSLTDGTKDLSISALTAAGSATLNGNVTLGNASSDDITVTGSLSSSIPIKTTNSYNIGSATLGLAGVYFGNAGGSTTIRLVSASSVASSRTYTIPDSGANADFVMNQGAQTINGIKTMAASDNTESNYPLVITNSGSTKTTSIGAYGLSVNTGAFDFQSDVEFLADVTVEATTNTGTDYPFSISTNDGSKITSFGAYGMDCNTGGYQFNCLTTFNDDFLATADVTVEATTNTGTDYPFSISNSAGSKITSFGAYGMDCNTGGYQFNCLSTFNDDLIAKGNITFDSSDIKQLILSRSSGVVQMEMLGAGSFSSLFESDNSNTRLEIRAGGSASGVLLNSGGTSWGALSDETKKDIIEPITDAAKKLENVRSVIYSYKQDESKKRRSGIIAQDIQKVLPEAVTEDSEGVLSVQYTELIPLLIASINELQQRILKLENT